MRIVGRLVTRLLIVGIIAAGFFVYEHYIEKRYNYSAPVVLAKGWKSYSKPGRFSIGLPSGFFVVDQADPEFKSNLARAKKVAPDIASGLEGDAKSASADSLEAVHIESNDAGPSRLTVLTVGAVAADQHLDFSNDSANQLKEILDEANPDVDFGEAGEIKTPMGKAYEWSGKGKGDFGGTSTTAVAFIDKYSLYLLKVTDIPTSKDTGQLTNSLVETFRILKS